MGVDIIQSIAIIYFKCSFFVFYVIRKCSSQYVVFQLLNNVFQKGQFLDFEWIQLVMFSLMGLPFITKFKDCLPSHRFKDLIFGRIFRVLQLSCDLLWVNFCISCEVHAEVHIQFLQHHSQKRLTLLTSFLLYSKSN